jgi:hypothetical protein
MPSQYHPTVSVLGHLPIAPVMESERERNARRPPLSSASSSSSPTTVSSSSISSPIAPAAQSLMQKVFGSRSNRHNDNLPQVKDAGKSAKSPPGRDISSGRREGVKELPIGEAATEFSSKRSKSPGPSTLSTLEIMRRLKLGQEGGTVEEKSDADRDRASLIGDLAHRVTMSLNASLPSSPREKGKDKEETADDSIPSFEDLLDVTIPNCSPYSPQPTREVAFALLGAILSLPSTVDSLGLTRTLHLFKLCLADPSASTLNPTKSATSWNSSPASEIIYRVGCLERLTRHGEDLSFGLECGLVGKLVQWIRSAGKDWATWCESDTLDVGLDEGFEGEPASSADNGDGKRGRDYGLNIDASAMPTGLALTGMKDQPEESAVKVDNESVSLCCYPH